MKVSIPGPICELKMRGEGYELSKLMSLADGLIVWSLAPSSGYTRGGLNAPHN